MIDCIRLNTQLFILCMLAFVSCRCDYAVWQMELYDVPPVFNYFPLVTLNHKNHLTELDKIEWNVC